MPESFDLDRWQQLQTEVIGCDACPRLAQHREKVAREKRRAYRDWTYWGKPVPSFGSPQARLLILGLAPGAHGANRTGRMFTGDRSGDLLYSTLAQFNFCNQSTSTDRRDGLRLHDTYIAAAIHCVPPGNRPSAEERKRCRPYLLRELKLLKNLRVVVALGRIAFDTYLSARRQLSQDLPRPRPRFAHGHHWQFQEGLLLIASYHPSQQNTLTGRLTREMFAQVFHLTRQQLDRSEAS